MRFRIFQDSRLGDREGNEDRIGYCYGRHALLMVVADGMGGHLQGEVAAELAVAEITRRFREQARNRLGRPAEFLAATFAAAHRRIVAHTEAERLLESPRTTCVACVVQDGVAWWAHAGDSRLYLLREGRLAAATRDHSRVQQMIEAGTITPQEAAVHPDRNKVYSCLGGVVPPVVAVSEGTTLRVGDTIVLSTDGFWSRIPPSLIAGQLRRRDIVELMPDLLGEAHRRARGESDNLSVVAMTWEAQDDATYADTQQLADESFRTSQDAPAPAEDLSEADIERAIAEIRSAIGKVPR